MADYARHSSLVTGCQWHHSSVSVTTATTQVTTTRPRTIRGPLYLHGYIVHHSSHPPTDAQAVYNCLHQPRVIVASHSTLTPPHRDPPSPLLPDILTLGLCVYSRWLSSAGHSEPRIPRVCGIPRCTLRRRRETDRVDGVGVIVASCSCGDEAGAHVCCREWHKGHVKCEGEVQIMNLNSSQVSRHRRDDQSLILISSIVTSHVRSQPR
jgi:hypothetical protein